MRTKKAKRRPPRTPAEGLRRLAEADPLPGWLLETSSRRGIEDKWIVTTEEAIIKDLAMPIYWGGTALFAVQFACRQEEV